jgi:chemotaxis protein CheD
MNYPDMARPGRTRREVYLKPGEFFFGGDGTRISTLLGSCVAIALWHPQRRIGGMCHYMLPASPQATHGGGPDGRYADGAIALFLRELDRAAARPAEFQVKLMGGARMFAHVHGEDYPDIGSLNIRHGRDLLARHGFTVCCEHLAGAGHRKVVFDLASGEVALRHDSRILAPASRGGA